MSMPSVGHEDRCRSIELRKGERWIKLSIYLGEEFTGGGVARLFPETKASITGADELSSSYGEANWMSGIASGVFYAYRNLGVPRRVVYLTEFAGRLRSADMPAVAEAAARAVAICLQRDAPPSDLEGWEVQTSKAIAKQETAASLATPPAAKPAIAE